MNGRAETVVDVPRSQLLAGEFAINVHKSQQESTTYVACGESRAQLAPATGAGARKLPVWGVIAAGRAGLLVLTRGFALRQVWR